LEDIVSNFKEGDRIAFYNNGRRFVGTIKYGFPLGTMFHVKDDLGSIITLHEKQIRRLVKKKKQNLGRELWFCRTNHEDVRFWHFLAKPGEKWDEVIHVREILE
jgi:hypothetical protein